MGIKKLGKAVIDLDEELWCSEKGNEKFLMNRRLIDARPDIKALKGHYAKSLNQDRKLTVGREQKRDKLIKTRTDYRRELRENLAKIYEEIFQSSFNSPLQLRRHRDFDHNSDWRYCLYKGRIYQFDRPGYSDEEMIEQINAVEVSR